VRQNKPSLLQQRLKRGTDKFDFNALIEGVSTLEEDSTASAGAGLSVPAVLAPDAHAAEPALLPEPLVSEPPAETFFRETHTETRSTEITVTETPYADALVTEVTRTETTILTALTAAPELAPAETVAVESETAVVPTMPVPSPDSTPAPEPEAILPAALVSSAPPPPAAPPATAPPSSTPVITTNREERLRAALDTLSCRLLREVNALQTHLHAQDAEEAGFNLAHINQILELLRSIDPTGDLSRQLDLPGAPPEGRGWFASSWSFAEFAASPLSALLPDDTTEAFVRHLLYAAWGVTFIQNDE
jgi:hypothetical protein